MKIYLIKSSIFFGTCIFITNITSGTIAPKGAFIHPILIGYGDKRFVYKKLATS